MIDYKQVKPDMSVVGSDDTQLALVDHIEGPATIKLKKDGKGQHHFIPLSWVKSVDDRLHLDRSKEQAERDWKTSS